MLEAKMSADTTIRVSRDTLRGVKALKLKYGHNTLDEAIQGELIKDDEISIAVNYNEEDD